MYNSAPSSLRFGLYVRKSSEQEDRQEQSIESQITTLQRYAAHNDLNIIQVFEDSASAHKVHNRPNFTVMMKALSQGKIDAILCWKADRLSRNPIEAGELIEKLRKEQIKQIVTPQTWYSPKDAFILYIHFGLADQYSIDLSANIKRGNKTKIEKGGFCGLAPAGYLNDPINKTIIKDPKRFKQIQKMFRFYLTGNYSLNEICTIANEQWGFTTIKRKRTGGNPMSIQSLHRILKSPFYYGIVLNGETKAQGNHTPMISEADFFKIQHLLQRYGAGRGKKPTPRFAYTGLIRCGECHRGITSEHKVKYKCPSKKCSIQHSAKNPRPCKCGQKIEYKHIKKGRFYTYYRCTKEMRRKQNQHCKQSYTPESILEEQVVHFLESIRPKAIFTQWTLKCLEQIKEQNLNNNKQHNALYKRKLTSLNSRLENLITMRSEGEITKEQFLKMQQKALDEKRKIKTQLKNAQKNTWIEDIKKQLSYMKTPKDNFKNLLPREKKELLKEIASNFFLKDKKLSIEPSKKVKALIDFQEELQVKNYCLELSVSLTGSGKTLILNEGHPDWWKRWEEIRTIFEEELNN